MRDIYIPSDQELPVANFEDTALLIGNVSSTATQDGYLLPCLLCFPLQPTYDVDIHERR